MSGVKIYIRNFLLFSFCLTGIIFPVSSQEKQSVAGGSVSYISGQNIYVKFESTKGIEDGDTLFITKNDMVIPALVVQNHSSVSCLCKPIGDVLFKVSDAISARIKIAPPKPQNEIATDPGKEKDVATEVIATTTQNKEKSKDQTSKTISGKITASSYSNFAANSPDSHRFRYTLIANAGKTDSKLSAETYISFTHKLGEWNLVKQNLKDAVKIYSLSLNYKFSKSISVSAGRKINPKMANAGAIDGLQVEFTTGNFFAGAVSGTRPDYADYGFNPDLFEYGAYIGQSSNSKNGFIQTSLAFLEQQNKFKTDRRFAYFQHSNSAIKNLSVFSSFELDLYKLENGQPKNTVSLTGLFLSMRYRFSSRLSILGSYDSRKNVIYYETFRNYADEIAATASRQGIRLSINYRPWTFLNVGLNGGTRFGNNDPRPTNTVNGNLNWTNIPAIKASVTLSANLMQTSYLDGKIFGAQLTKDFADGKFQTMFNYRYVDFSYVSSLSKMIQHIGEVDFSYQVNKNLFLSVNMETTFQDKANFNRLYLNVRKKF
jgi:hypothetical protein